MPDHSSARRDDPPLFLWPRRAAGAASARALAALADRDVAEFRTQLRGHHHVLSALRETQLEQGRKIDEQGQEIREGFATLLTGMAQITALLTTIARSKSDGSRTTRSSSSPAKYLTSLS